MTAVGKILVIMNLLLSALTCGMIALVFTTRTNWKSEYEKVRNISLVAEASYKSKELALQNEFNSRIGENESLRNGYRAKSEEYDKLLANNADLLTKLGAAESDNKKYDVTQKTLEAANNILKDERTTLTKDNQALKERTLILDKEVNDQKLLAVTNRIEADSQKQRAQQLLNRVEALEKDNTQLTNKLVSLGASTEGGRDSLLNPKNIPAPRDVYGTVKAVATSGLTVINIGSDSGISAGNKLFVYRVDAKGPLFLGEIEISRTEPKQAVGQFKPKPYAKADERLPKDNDIVSTSLGSR